MKSPLDSINEEYDVAIIGGGIVGAGIFRDLSLHGAKCLLVDKNDFSSQTSQSSSKMLHGGLRYLENFDFHLVWEALHEKNLWLRIAPHLCSEKDFHFPVYKDSPKPLWMIRIGLMLYDILSNFLNKPHSILSPSELRDKFPSLNREGLRGVGVYHDVVVDDAKLTLEVIYDALLEKKGKAINYVEATSINPCKDFVEVTLRDTLIPHEIKKIKAKHIVFATGPFTDKLLKKFSSLKWSPKLLPSKGSHIWLKKETLKINHPIVLTTPDNRIIFTIPRKEAILVGTTEVQTEENFFNIKASKEEIDYLLETLRTYFPNENISKDSVLSSFAGIRPLVSEDPDGNLGKTARVHKTYQPFHNVFVIIGGKYTTFRVMGQDISRNILYQLGTLYNKDRTEAPLRQQSEIIPFLTSSERKEILTPKKIEAILENELVRTFDDLLKRRIGIPGKSHWINAGEFDEFFLGLYDQLKAEIKISKEDIFNF